MNADAITHAAVATRHYIVGTAGHIDHGKSSLVRALTGTDPDRLPEEKRRGMTIELGFAELAVGDACFGIVDVPGHERFVRTMVAGAAGIDMVLFVVAADDSIMPQSVEHAEILHLLGVTQGIVVISKIDAVDPDLVTLVTEDIRNALEGTGLASAPICPVSSVTGAGLEELKRTLVEVSRTIVVPPPQPPFRMAIDRVFTVQGRGTVVTGSVLRGRVADGDLLDVLPIAASCRVRGLQTHGLTSSTLARGQRAAVNVTGIEREQLQRGFELATPGYLQPTRMVNVRLRCLPSYGRPLKSSTVVRLEMGTAETLVRVVLWESDGLMPGESTLAQLRSGTAFAASYGQRFILRDENATRTIGGGIVLDPLARRRRRDDAAQTGVLRELESADTARRVEQVLRLAGFKNPTGLELSARAGVEPGTVPDLLENLKRTRRLLRMEGTDVWVAPAAIDDLSRRLTHWLERHHREHAESPGRPVESVLGWLERMAGRPLAKPLFDELLRRQAFKVMGKFACLPAFAPTLTAADEKKLTAMVDAIRKGGFTPPSIDDLAGPVPADRKRYERLATLAVAMQELVAIEPPIYLHSEVETQLRRRVAECIAGAGGGTVAQIRESLGSSRKFVVPFLEYLDRVGFTKRVGDLRHLAASSKPHSGPTGDS